MNSYRKPTVIHYERDEIIEMMGPVRTQYGCDCNTDVPPIIEKSDQVQVSVTINGDCDDFQTVLIYPTSAPGGQGGLIALPYEFDRSEGMRNGNRWTFNLGIIGLELGPEGEYCFEVVLLDASGNQVNGGGGFNGEPQPGDSIECGEDCLILQ